MTVDDRGGALTPRQRLLLRLAGRERWARVTWFAAYVAAAIILMQAVDLPLARALPWADWVNVVVEILVVNVPLCVAARLGTRWAERRYQRWVLHRYCDVIVLTIIEETRKDEP